MGSNAASLSGIIALLATILAGIAQALWNRREARARVAAEAAAAEALRQREAAAAEELRQREEKAADERRQRERQERQEDEARAKREAEAKADREVISQRLRALETARQEHQLELTERRVEMVAVTAGMTRLESKLDKVLDAVIGHNRSAR